MVLLASKVVAPVNLENDFNSDKEWGFDTDDEGKNSNEDHPIIHHVGAAHRLCAVRANYLMPRRWWAVT
tara:strand:- start:265 stop:471 length:207 start_codon:yes stop_codon:yes gene_type:complete